MNATTSNAPVMRAASVSIPPDAAFRVFTDEIGAWWPLRTHGVFGDDAGGLHFRDNALVEVAADGRVATWGEVLEWRPPELVVITWHPGGAADGPASRVEIRFEPDGAGTRVVLVHAGWEAFGEEGVRRRRNLVGPNAWGYVLDLFADAAEGPLDTTDLDALRTAYDAFFAEAERGDFGPAPDGEWDAAQVIAHVALNDLAMTAVCHSIVHGSPRGFENVVCQDRDVLAATIDRCGDGVLEFGRACADQLVATVRRMRPEQLDEPIHCRLDHDGHRVLEATLPWREVVVVTQASRHLPAHTGQLADLRR